MKTLNVSDIDYITELIAQVNDAIDKINSKEIIADRAKTANNADHATTVGTANIAKNAEQINDLVLKRDNGVLKIGDAVIPQKKLVMNSPIMVGNESVEIYNNDAFLSGRTFKIVDTLGAVYKIIIDPTNTISKQFAWVGYIYDAAFNNKVLLRVEPNTPKILSAVCDGEGYSFTIEKIYEIIE